MSQNPDLLITIDLSGFEQYTLTDNVAYNLLGCKQFHLLMSEDLPNEIYMGRPLYEVYKEVLGGIMQLPHKGDVRLPGGNLGRGEGQGIQAPYVYGQWQMKHLGTSLDPVLLYFNAVKQKDTIGLIGEIFFQVFLQRLS